ncbi:MAG TPA: hypothetical protein VF317_13830 [Dermatophilaceae bacterium]
MRVSTPTLRSPLLPPGLVAGAGVVYLRPVSLAGNNLALIAVLLAAGITLGTLSGTATSVWRQEDRVLSRAGLLAAFLIAGGLINMTRQVGGSIGLAVITAVITSHLHGQAHSLATFNGGLRDALTVAAVIGAAGVVIAGVVLPRRSRSVPMAKTVTAIAITTA